MISIILIYPSSAKHAPLCDYELTPIEYVRYHRKTVSEEEKILSSVSGFSEAKKMLVKEFVPKVILSHYCIVTYMFQ